MINYNEICRGFIIESFDYTKYIVLDFKDYYDEYGVKFVDCVCIDSDNIISRCILIENSIFNTFTLYDVVPCLNITNRNITINI